MKTSRQPEVLFSHRTLAFCSSAQFSDSTKTALLLLFQIISEYNSLVYFYFKAKCYQSARKVPIHIHILICQWHRAFLMSSWSRHTLFSGHIFESRKLFPLNSVHTRKVNNIQVRAFILPLKRAHTFIISSRHLYRTTATSMCVGTRHCNVCKQRLQD